MTDSQSYPVTASEHVCSLCLGTGKVFHENPPRKDTPYSRCHCQQVVAPHEKLGRSGAVAQGWRDISTAPTDGTTKILLWWKHAGISIGWWHYDEFWQERKWAHKALEYGWMSEGDACIPVNQKNCTHWQPLPAGPVVSSTEGK